ncbi:hypothetical protein LOTGIDRAFT_231829 [Lottia gigantea]|uniref:DRBM domain-containing protein n=1 Tax=Lottia gigantea TaxID=225164 RepID=V4AGR4_LOTGI|nr:hypothetical protein LOTGIDRAFT_231829 [Lottia gigantea]ESO96087.1 hypothetical protein LOTGIDRAFT_231829 [Lottia gigantea]
MGLVQIMLKGAEGDMKWETLPGSQSRPKEKKPQAAAKAPTVDASKLPLPEKIRRLSLFLRNEKREVNEIMLFENSIMSCKLGIKPDFLIDEMIQGKNGSFFTGRLIFDGVFLARHIASNKKVIKLTCYKRAVEMFRTMSVTEIMSQKDITAEELKQKLDNLNSTVAKVEKETIKDLPTVEVLKKLQEILKNPKYTPSNAVSNLEQAAAVAKCRIRCRYDVEQGQSTTGRIYFKGSYYIDNVVQGLGFSVSKKTAKANCYNMVVQRLMTCKAEDILSGLDPSIGEKALSELNASMKIVPKSAKNLDLREKFVRLKELLAVSDLTPDVITAMDLMFADVKLTPVCLYRQGPKQDNPDQKPVLFCNLYLAGRLMAIGEASNRTEAQIDSYTNSKDIVLTTEPEVILTQHYKLQAHDQAAPDVIDFRVKGNCVLRNNCTNFHRLQRTKLKVSDTPVKDIVLYEHASWSSDRKVQGFCILQHSCFLNNMLLEWEFSDDNNSTQFRCDMKIQKENIGTQPAKSVSKIGSRNLAAADILFKLYETQPVIQITTYTKMEESTKCITFDEVLDAAIELHKAAKNAGEDVEMAPPSEEAKPVETEFKMEQDVKTEEVKKEEVKTEKVKTEPKDDDVEMKEENQDENKPHTFQRRRRPFKYLTKFILQDVKRRVDEFTKVKSLEDMLFGPSYPSQIGRQIAGILRNSTVPLRYMTRPIRGSMYTIVTQSMTPNEMAAFLKERCGSSGRFKLVDKSELPSHKDIVPELTSGEIQISQNSQPNQDHFFDDVSIESNSEFHTAMSSQLGDNSAYQSTYDTTLTSNSSANSSLVTPKKEDMSLPSTPIQGNTSTPKQNMTSTPVQKKTPASKKKL